MGAGAWLAWTATGLCAAGAVASGLLAYRWEQNLRDQRDSYPVTQEALANQQGKVRTAGWVTDGLMAGTVAFAAISLTLTFRGSHDKSVSLSPRGLTLRQTF
jgi:DNA-binding IclR family transcriptional regulator